MDRLIEPGTHQLWVVVVPLSRVSIKHSTCHNSIDSDSQIITFYCKIKSLLFSRCVIRFPKEIQNSVRVRTLQYAQLESIEMATDIPKEQWAQVIEKVGGRKFSSFTSAHIVCFIF